MQAQSPSGARKDPRVALALFYAAHFAHMGIVLPFLPLWFLASGLDSVSIGVLLALLPLTKVLAPWTWGLLADRTGVRRGLLVFASVAGAGALVVVAHLSGFAALVPGVALYALCVAPSLPFAEATALEQADGCGFAYGRVRLWGSLAFVATAWGAGVVGGRTPPDELLFAAAGFLVLAAVAARRFPLPERPSAPIGPLHLPTLTLGQKLREPSLWRLLAACALMQAGHGPYYAFYSIRLEHLGYGGAAIGGLWAFAVLCEVLLLTRIDAGIDRFGTGAVLRISLVAAFVRWLTIAAATGPAVLAAAQILHALTYAAFHVAALREIHRRFRSTDRATGLALYSGLSFGLGIFAGTLGAGFMAEIVGIGGLFGVAAALALAALLILPGGAAGGGER
jgi:PPP family 3-phenylpropionic acid transporter